MQKWEYKRETVLSLSSTDETLNQLGQDGWELVGVVPEYESELSGEFGRFSLDLKKVYLHLKRPR